MRRRVLLVFHLILISLSCSQVCFSLMELVFLSRLYFDMPLLFELFIGRHKRGRLVSWVEKAGLDRIRRLLEIIKNERNHELLLFVKTLQELGASPFPYIVPVIPHSLPEELIKGEHFIFVDLLKSIPGRSLEAGSA